MTITERFIVTVEWNAFIVIVLCKYNKIRSTDPARCRISNDYLYREGSMIKSKSLFTSLFLVNEAVINKNIS